MEVVRRSMPMSPFSPQPIPLRSVLMVQARNAWMLRSYLNDHREAFAPSIDNFRASGG